jgi:type I restriction enzyme R subunit
VRHHKALADIISLVKKAVDEGAPLLTAEERVNQALAQVTAGQTFTEEQQRWLGRIRAHLVQNLSVDQVDFDLIPALSDPGGWGKANRVFQGRLDSIIQQINEAIAA